MGNFTIKIELDRIPGAKIMDIKGDVATAYESANQSFGSSHYIKPQVSREYFERMSETQVRGLPLIGSLQPWKIAPKKEEVKDEDNW